MSATMTEAILAPLIESPVAPLCMAANVLPDDVSITLLYQGNLPDSSQVFIVRDAHRLPRAIVQLSAPASPDMVARGAAHARDARAQLGPALGRSVLLPTSEGEIDGRSYAIMPYCVGFSSSRARWFFERLRLRPIIFRWLREVAAQTVMPASEADRVDKYEKPLRNLLAFDNLSEPLRRLTAQALARLLSGAWSPRHVLMHGDLWKGNLLLRQHQPAGPQSSFADRVVVIDWAGSKARGYAIFDLLRAGESLRLSSQRLRSEALQHGKILGCQPVDVASYALAAMAGMLGELEEFPVERFVGMAESTVRTLLRAMPEVLGAESRTR